MRPLRICLVSSEVTPFAKTGGLADVAAALAGFLARAGHDVRLFVPFYRRIERAVEHTVPEPRLTRVPMRLGERELAFSIERAALPHSRAQVSLVRCPELYDRDAIYDDAGDEHLRFAFLSRAALESCQWLQWAPDVVHCNDWHTGLIPLFLRTRYAWDRLFESTRTVLTIHNLAYQGVFPASALGELGLESERELFHQEHLAAGHFGFLETGLLYADALTTVSETYAREIQGAGQGFGLDGLLRARSDRLVGIVNGIDADEWNPATDPHLPHRYDARNLAGKARNKRALLEDFELDADPRAMTFGIVSRLTAQKGFDLLPDVLPVLLHRENVRLVVLGSGEARYEQYFQWLRDTFPTKVAVYRGYQEQLAHRIEAGADAFLMPSRFEPCGLNQMYSLRYGTVPIVRRTGGLADTVEAYDPVTERGTGFVFDAFTSDALLGAMRAALELYADAPAWERLVRAGMARDFSWERQGERYVDLYRRLAPAPAT